MVCDAMGDLAATAGPGEAPQGGGNGRETRSSGARHERYDGGGGDAKGQAKAIQRYSAEEDRLTGKGQIERSSTAVILCRAQKTRAVARYAGRCPGPRQGRSPETPAPFPFFAMFRNGPRPPGCATENLFKTRKDSPPPRTNRA